MNEHRRYAKKFLKSFQSKESQDAYLRGRREQKREDTKKFIEDLNDCLKFGDDGFGNKISCDCESNVIKKLEKWQMSKIEFDNNGVIMPQKVNYEVEHDEETRDLLNNIEKEKLEE